MRSLEELHAKVKENKDFIEIIVKISFLIKKIFDNTDDIKKNKKYLVYNFIETIFTEYI